MSRQQKNSKLVSLTLQKGGRLLITGYKKKKNSLVSEIHYIATSDVNHYEC